MQTITGGLDGTAGESESEDEFGETVEEGPAATVTTTAAADDSAGAEEDEDVDPEQEQYLKMVADLGCVGQFLVKK